MKVTGDEIRKAIEVTKAEIYRLKSQLEEITDPKEEKRILAKLKELRIRQLWYLDQLG